MNTRKSLGISMLSVALLLATGIPGLAKNLRSIALSHDAVMGNTTLPAGQYVIEWESHNPDTTVNSYGAGKLSFRPKAGSRTAVGNTIRAWLSTAPPLGEP